MSAVIYRGLRGTEFWLAANHSWRLERFFGQFKPSFRDFEKLRLLARHLFRKL